MIHIQIQIKVILKAAFLNILATYVFYKKIQVLNASFIIIINNYIFILNLDILFFL